MPRHYQGVSLVEALVALGLGVVLALAASVAYVQAKRDFLFQRQLVQLQDTGGYALRLLGREISLSGFFGSMPPGISSSLSPPGEGCTEAWALEMSVGLEVLDDLHVDTMPVTALQSCLDFESVMAGSDVVAVKRTATEPSVYAGDLATGLSTSETKRWYLHVGEEADLSWRIHSAKTLRQLDTPMSASYWRAISGIYFVRTWAVEKGDGIPTLCVEALAGSTMPVRCLAEGVEDLQLQFGFDTDGDGVANRYGDADSGDLSEAISARVFIVVRTLEVVHNNSGLTALAVGDHKKSYPADGYARRVVATTVPLDARVRPL
ncbi:MAG: PilW family protein [Halioglobus sp.]